MENYGVMLKALALLIILDISILVGACFSVEPQTIKDQKTVPSAPETVSNIRVVIDPGHGGYDVGLLSGELKEKDITLSLARDMEAALLKKSRHIFLTRRADQFLSFNDRALFANQKYADIFISLHLSQSGSFVIYTVPAEPVRNDPAVSEPNVMALRQARYVEKSRAFGLAVGKSLGDEFKMEVKYRDMPLPLLGSIGAPAVMIEIPGNIVKEAISRKNISAAIIRGAVSYANK